VHVVENHPSEEEGDTEVEQRKEREVWGEEDDEQTGKEETSTQTEADDRRPRGEQGAGPAVVVAHITCDEVDGRAGEDCLSEEPEPSFREAGIRVEPWFEALRE
jgi:hypothetical protein